MGIAARTFALVSMIAAGIAAGVAISPGLRAVRRPVDRYRPNDGRGRGGAAAECSDFAGCASLAGRAEKSSQAGQGCAAEGESDAPAARSRIPKRPRPNSLTSRKDWGRKLHDREVNNQNHIAFQEKDGWETASYTGYGPVQKCECHQSKDGYSIGKVTYDEFRYYLKVGKTTDDAKHATPKVTDSTATTRAVPDWDKEKWFY